MRSMHGWRAVLLAGILLAVASGGGDAETNKAVTGPLERAALDATVHKTLRDVINQGADLYNAGDTAGCYRLYEGALLGLRPLLDHRPELQKTIADGLRDAKQTQEQFERAFVLRRVLDKVRGTVNPALARKSPEPIKVVPKILTLWDRVGGEDGVRRVIDEFIVDALTDPRVNFLRGGKVTLDAAALDGLKQKMVEQISSATGGPFRFKGKTMKAAHAGMGITESEFDALAVHLKTALQKNGAKNEDVELVMAFVGGMRKEIVEPVKEAPKPTPMPPPVNTETKSLWERLGGGTKVTAAVDDFVAAASADPKVNFARDGRFQPDVEALVDLKKKLVDQISALSGGPFKYTGKTMKAAHAGMGITDGEFDALAGHLKAALEKHGAKGDDVKLVLAAVEAMRKDIVEPNK